MRVQVDTERRKDTDWCVKLRPVPLALDCVAYLLAIPMLLLAWAAGIYWFYAIINHDESVLVKALGILIGILAMRQLGHITINFFRRALFHFFGSAEYQRKESSLTYEMKLPGRVLVKTFEIPQLQAIYVEEKKVATRGGLRLQRTINIAIDGELFVAPPALSESGANEIFAGPLGTLAADVRAKRT